MKIDELLSEGDEIQKRIQSTKRKEEDSKKGVTRLMRREKVRSLALIVKSIVFMFSLTIYVKLSRKSIQLIDGNMPRVE